MTELVRLSKSDLANIEAQIEGEIHALGALPTLEARTQAELAILGGTPTLSDLRQEGLSEERGVNAVLDFIASAGRIITLFAVEFAQAFAALILTVFLIILEADRINAGVLALGQHAEAAALMAVVFTSLNFILPIYRLRNLSGQSKLPKTHWTGRGFLTAFVRRLFGLPQNYQVDVHHNPTLTLTESAITWATLFLAFYSVLHPMLARTEGLVWWEAVWALVAESDLASMLQLLAGFLLSVGGVFGVQSIGHELGVRRLTDKTPRLADVLQERKANYVEQRQAVRARARADNDAAHVARADQVAAIREQVKSEYMAAKVAEQERRKADLAANPIQPVPELTPIFTAPSGNGNGRNGHVRGEN